jgi:hypothetical protein
LQESRAATFGAAIACQVFRDVVSSSGALSRTGARIISKAEGQLRSFAATNTSKEIKQYRCPDRNRNRRI